MASNRVKRTVVGGLSVLTAGSVIGLAATQPLSVATGLVDLTALIVVGSSTNPSGSGVEDFYGGMFQPETPQEGDTVYVSFLAGPPGIKAELDRHTGERNVILTSGWGASNASQVLNHDRDDPDVKAVLWVLDNNLNIPNGGFATRYPLFSQLVLIDPTPTPTDTDATVIQVRYEYDINSDTPAYVLNPAAMANTLAAYFERRLNQADVDLPLDETGDVDRLDVNGNPCTSVCTVETTSGLADIKKVGKVTYVTYRSDGLPLTNLLRDFGGDLGNRVADVVEPALKAAVDYGYPDNDPLGDPDVLKPARLVPTAQETQTFLTKFHDGVEEGLDILGDEGQPTTSETLAAASDSPDPKPRTDVVKPSPFFKPGKRSTDTSQTGPGAADPFAAFADAVTKTVSYFLKGAKPPTTPTTSDPAPATDSSETAGP